MDYRDELIRGAKGQKRLSNAVIAERAGVGVSTVVRACNGDPVNAGNLQAIARVLDIPFADLFEPKPQQQEASV